MNRMTYVLVPGAGGSAWYWHRVESELRQRGHDVVAVDLPAADDRAGLPEYADTVVNVTGDRADVVLVAQSMAGFTAPLVCGRVAVSLLVFVNAMIPVPGETPGDWWVNTGQAEAQRENDIREGRDPDAEFDVVTVFFHDVPPDVKDVAMAHEPAQSGTPFASRCSFEAWPDVPIRVVIGSDDRLFPAEFQRRVARDRLGIGADEVPGGHLVALSRPKELVDRLEAYTAELELAGSARKSRRA
jgi:pimeloyl-ACP methyl ester carboxylesterase